MIARAAAGFVLGAALAGGVAWACFRDAGARPAAGAAKADPAETDALLAEIASIEKTAQGLREEERRLVAAASVAPAKPRAAERRLALAKRVGTAALKFGEDGFLETAEGQLLGLEFHRWISELCEETGLTPDEAVWAPAGLWAFFIETLTAAEPPLPDEARRAFEERIAAFRGEWDAYLAARPNLSTLERWRDTLGFYYAFGSAVGDTVPPAFLGVAASAFENLPLASPHPERITRFLADPRFEVHDNLVNAWAEALGLDETQRPALDPIADDFMLGYAELLRATADQSGTDWPARYRGLFDLMIAVKKEIGEKLGLKGESAERLKRWATLYTFPVAK